MSEERAAAERSLDPIVGDYLEHPALGTLEVLAVDDRRIEVRDKSRRHRKLARACLDLRFARERSGRRVLTVILRSSDSEGAAGASGNCRCGCCARRRG